MQDVKVRLSTLWVFMLLNYLYCDVLGLFDPGLPKNLTQEALLAASFLMEIPIAMVLLSRTLQYRPDRWANVIAGAFMAVVQASTLFVGTAPTTYYVFFSVIEIACLLFIVWTAWRWADSAPATQLA
jgi:threonine/homoserine/homoserine lactone efflux protein